MNSHQQRIIKCTPTMMTIWRDLTPKSIKEGLSPHMLPFPQFVAATER